MVMRSRRRSRRMSRRSRVQRRTPKRTRTSRKTQKTRKSRIRRMRGGSRTPQSSPNYFYFIVDHNLTTIRGLFYSQGIVKLIPGDQKTELQFYNTVGKREVSGYEGKLVLNNPVSISGSFQRTDKRYFAVTGEYTDKDGYTTEQKEVTFKPCRDDQKYAAMRKCTDIGISLSFYDELYRKFSASEF